MIPSEPQRKRRHLMAKPSIVAGSSQVDAEMTDLDCSEYMVSPYTRILVLLTYLVRVPVTIRKRI